MPRGGARPGAGRKKAAASNNPNMVAKRQLNERQKFRDAALITSGKETPLEFFYRTMHDEKRTHSERMEAAKAAKDLVHPRLSSSEVKVDDRRTVDELSIDEIERALREDGVFEAGSSAQNGAKKPDSVH